MSIKTSIQNVDANLRRFSADLRVARYNRDPYLAVVLKRQIDNQLDLRLALAADHATYGD